MFIGGLNWETTEGMPDFSDLAAPFATIMLGRRTETQRRIPQELLHTVW